MVCVDAVNTKQIVVEAGMSWWLILVHAQSVSGVGNVWVPESGGVVQVVFTELGGAACAPAAGVSIRVTRSWGGYIWSRYHSVAWGEDGLEWMHVLWVGGWSFTVVLFVFGRGVGWLVPVLFGVGLGRACWLRAGRLASRCVFKMDLRLGRRGGNGGFGAGVDVGFVYPPRRVIVVRDRCSAGDVGGGKGFPRGYALSGWGPAGSLRVSVMRNEVVVVVVALVRWKALGWRGPKCSWYHARTLSAPPKLCWLQVGVV